MPTTRVVRPPDAGPSAAHLAAEAAIETAISEMTVVGEETIEIGGVSPTPAEQTEGEGELELDEGETEGELVEDKPSGKRPGKRPRGDEKLGANAILAVSLATAHAAAAATPGATPSQAAAPAAGAEEVTTRFTLEGQEIGRGTRQTVEIQLPLLYTHTPVVM